MYITTVLSLFKRSTRLDHTLQLTTTTPLLTHFGFTHLTGHIYYFVLVIIFQSISSLICHTHPPSQVHP